MLEYPFSHEKCTKTYLNFTTFNTIYNISIHNSTL